MAQVDAPAPEPQDAPGPQVTQHLDRDPNDPRNQGDTPKLPSLNDPGQSGPIDDKTGK